MANYAADSDIQSVFGINTVIGWSNLDATSSVLNTARTQFARNYADAEINQFLGTVMATPVPIGPTVTYMAAVIAGVWLYNSRGQQDSPKGGGVNKYSKMLAMVYEDLGNYTNGIKRFPGASYTASTAPSVAMAPNQQNPSCPPRGWY